MSAPSSAGPLLEMREITKDFPGVRALDRVSFDLGSGEIHAFAGENGAGKSTLMKILGGVYTEYEGEIRMDGAPVRFRGVREAERAGIAVVFQELSLVRELTVGENIFLGREPARMGVVRWEELYAKTEQLLRKLRLDIDPACPVGKLGTGKQQLVEIAKAFSHDARVLVLDEPTAALTGAEAESLFATLRELRKQGAGIIYISHRLEEVFELCDRITVLRDGRAAGTENVADTDRGQVIAKMVGREVAHLFPEARRAPGETVLEVRHFSVEESGRQAVRDVSFSVRRGEIVGIAGLMGAGRTELLTSLFGARTDGVSGEILVNGKPARIQKPADAIALGMAFVTEDRKASGLVLGQTILWNMTLVALERVSGRIVTSEAREIAASRGLFDDLRIRANSLFAVAGTLSGGNQQKVVLGKWLMEKATVLLLDEPTRGIDVGAKQEIYGLIDGLAKSGVAVLMASSELPEVLGLSDRILVLHEGTLAGEFTRQEATPEAVMACATGQARHIFSGMAAGTRAEAQG